MHLLIIEFAVPQPLECPGCLSLLKSMANALKMPDKKVCTEMDDSDLRCAVRLQLEQWTAAAHCWLWLLVDVLNLAADGILPIKQDCS